MKKKNRADLLTGLKLIGKNGISLFQYKKIGDKKIHELCDTDRLMVFMQKTRSKG